MQDYMMAQRDSVVQNDVGMKHTVIAYTYIRSHYDPGFDPCVSSDVRVLADVHVRADKSSKRDVGSFRNDGGRMN
jgi:hypothetical protein